MPKKSRSNLKIKALKYPNPIGHKKTQILKVIWVFYDRLDFMNNLISGYYFTPILLNVASGGIFITLEATKRTNFSVIIDRSSLVSFS